MNRRTLLAWMGGVAVIYGGMFLIGSLVLGRFSGVLVSGAVLLAGLLFVMVGLRGAFRPHDGQKSIYNN
jgi:hypothetical protein